MKELVAPAVAAITFTLWDDSHVGSREWLVGTIVLAVVYVCGVIAGWRSESQQ